MPSAACLIAGRGTFQTDTGNADLHVFVGSNFNARVQLDVAGDADILVYGGASDGDFVLGDDSNTVGGNLTIDGTATTNRIVRSTNLASLDVGGRTLVQGFDISLEGTNTFGGPISLQGATVLVEAAADMSFEELSASDSLTVEMFGLSFGTEVSATVLPGATVSVGSNLTTGTDVLFIVAEDITLAGHVLVKSGIRIGTAQNPNVTVNCSTLSLDSATLEGFGTLVATLSDSSTLGNSPIFPGTDGQVGTLTLQGDVVAKNTVFIYDVNGLAMDLIVVTGDIDLNDSQVSFNNQSTSTHQINDVVTILQVSGTRTGNWSNAPEGSFFEFAPNPPPLPIVQYRANGNVDLLFTANVITNGSGYEGEVVPAYCCDEYSGGPPSLGTPGWLSLSGLHPWLLQRFFAQ